MNSDDVLQPVKSEDELWQWIADHLGLRIPRKALCGHPHHAPFEYICKSYFEPGIDIVVWGPRGGGKTRLAALATLLDLLHKPGSSIRILGGSQAQSLRMWDYLVPDLQKLLEGTKVTFTARSGWVRLSNGSFAAAIAQSQRAVRGLRIQKLRCDEVELFDPKIYEAAQLTTRSMTDSNGKPVRGTIESLSTLHLQWGLMNRVIDQAVIANRPVIKWCVLDVLAKCPPERDCKTCPLEEDCKGAAKQSDGFYDIDDAINAKLRTSKESWEAEMLCKRPSTKGAVFPTFEPAVHVVNTLGHGEMSLAMDFGFNNPFVCLWIVDDGANVHVLDEYVQQGVIMEEHIKVIEARPWGKVRRVTCDPAGNSVNDQTAKSNTKVLQEHQYLCFWKGSQIVDGVEMIRRALRTAGGQTTLTIHPRCVNLIKAMRAYHYPPQGGEKPVKDNEHDHLIDALRYFYVNRRSGDERKLRGGRRY
jgi:hypothetical protein